MEGIYNNYKVAYDKLNESLDCSISMMVQLIEVEDPNDNRLKEESLFLRDYIKNCPLERKLQIIKELDL